MKKKIVYSFLGLPASGKGTQVELFAKKRNLTVISIGDLVREEISKLSETPDKEKLEMIKHYNEGTPQDDGVVFNLINKKLMEINSGAVFDNFPFSLKQAEYLFKYIHEKKWATPVLIVIDIKETTSFKRINSRKVCTKCKTIVKKEVDKCPKCGSTLTKRKDDNPEILKKRIKYYMPRMKKMQEFYQKNGNLVLIDGEPSISEVSKQLDKI